MTALQLREHGFSVVSDGFVAIDPEGVVQAGPPEVAVDTPVAERLFADLEQSERSSGRDRRTVHVGPTRACPLVALVLLTVRGGLDQIVVHRITGHSAAMSVLRVEPLIRDVPPPPRELLTEVPAWSLARKSPETMEDLVNFGPQSVARTIADTVGAALP